MCHEHAGEKPDSVFGTNTQKSLWRSGAKIMSDVCNELARTRKKILGFIGAGIGL